MTQQQELQELREQVTVYELATDPDYTPEYEPPHELSDYSFSA